MSDGVEAAVRRVERRQAAEAARARGEQAPSEEDLRDEFHAETRASRQRTYTRAPRRKLTWKDRLKLSGALTVVLVPVLFMGCLIGLGWYDKAHPVTVQCTLTSAEAITITSSSRTVHTSSAAVVIETKPCGRMLIKRGIGFDNNKAVAAKLKPGATYAIEVGSGTYNMREFLGALKMRPEVFTYHRVG